MKIINLVENTEGVPGCACEHGLSFYIETDRHRLLFDLGPSEAALRNAEKLGIDLTQVDTVILSHGHYDHSGGILPFTRINSDAKIYMQDSADGAYYADDGEQKAEERYRYIGIDREIDLLPQVVKIHGDCRIDEELELFTVSQRTHMLPFSNRNLMEKKGEEYIRDSFSHEQFLVIHEQGKNVLLSGCAHNGILSILDAYREKLGSLPDLVISGFHLKKKTGYSDEEIAEIIGIAEELKKLPTKFVTCHCTGVPVYKVMKNTMGDRLGYVHSGEEIDVDGLLRSSEKVKKRRNTYMKWHRFFAWATVFSFAMTMVTGYKRK